MRPVSLYIYILYALRTETADACTMHGGEMMVLVHSTRRLCWVCFCVYIYLYVLYASHTTLKHVSKWTRIDDLSKYAGHLPLCRSISNRTVDGESRYLFIDYIYSSIYEVYLLCGWNVSVILYFLGGWYLFFFLWFGCPAICGTNKSSEILMGAMPIGLLFYYHIYENVESVGFPPICICCQICTTNCHLLSGFVAGMFSTSSVRCKYRIAMISRVNQRSYRPIDRMRGMRPIMPHMRPNPIIHRLPEWLLYHLLASHSVFLGAFIRTVPVQKKMDKKHTYVVRACTTHWSVWSAVHSYHYWPNSVPLTSYPPTGRQ